MTLRVFDLAALHAMLDRYPKAHGGPALRAAIAQMTDDGDRSERGLEDDLLDLVLGAVAAGHMPRPQVNATIEDGWRGDLVWPEAKLIVEADGARWHDGPIARRRDHERQAALEAAGWHVIRVRAGDLRDPARLLRRILAALARARCLSTERRPQ